MPIITWDYFGVSVKKTIKQKRDYFGVGSFQGQSGDHFALGDHFRGRKTLTSPGQLPTTGHQNLVPRGCVPFGHHQGSKTSEPAHGRWPKTLEGPGDEIVAPTAQ